jgi:hypothetical protein
MFKCLFKNLDILGNEFRFTIKGQKTFKTMLGGMFTTMYLITVLFFSFLLGADFYFRTNPSITYQANIDKSRKWNVLQDIMSIEWSVRDYYQEEKDFKNKLFPLVEYRSLFDGKFYETQLSYGLCDEKTEFGHYDYCTKPLNNSQLKLGTESFYEYGSMSLSFSFCQNGVSYNKTNGFCKSEQDVITFTRDLFLWVTIPQLIYYGSNYHSPVQIVNTTYSVPMDVFMQKIDSLTLKATDVYDDKGWLLPQTTNSTFITFEQRETSYFYYMPEDVFKEGSIYTTFYTLNIDLSRKFDIIKRSYMKIQDLWAVLGGVMTSTLIIIRNLTLFFNLHFIKELFMNEIFIDEQVKTPEISDSLNYNKIKSHPHIFKIHTKSNLNLNNSSSSQLKFLSSSKKLHRKVNIKEEMNELTDISSNSKIEPIREYANPDLSELNKVIKKQKESNIEFTVKLKLKNMLFKRCLSENEKKRSAIFNLVEQYISQRLDALYYINMVNDFSLLKHIVMNDAQINTFNYRKKINVQSPDIKDFFHECLFPDDQKNINEIISYYRVKEYKQLEPIDVKLLKTMHHELITLCQKNN